MEERNSLVNQFKILAHKAFGDEVGKTLVEIMMQKEEVFGALS